VKPTGASRKAGNNGHYGLLYGLSLIRIEPSTSATNTQALRCRRVIASRIGGSTRRGASSSTVMYSPNFEDAFAIGWRSRATCREKLSLDIGAAASLGTCGNTSSYHRAGLPTCWLRCCFLERGGTRLGTSAYYAVEQRARAERSYKAQEANSMSPRFVRGLFAGGRRRIGVHRLLPQHRGDPVLLSGAANNHAETQQPML
jgi:hypothetical protein